MPITIIMRYSLIWNPDTKTVVGFLDPEGRWCKSDDVLELEVSLDAVRKMLLGGIAESDEHDSDTARC